VRVVPVAQKLSRQVYSAKMKVVYFDKEITETKATIPQKTLGSSLEENVFCNFVSKHKRIELRTKLSQQGQNRSKSHKPENCSLFESW
jgi:hypothetical protein